MREALTTPFGRHRPHRAGWGSLGDHRVALAAVLCLLLFPQRPALGDEEALDVARQVWFVNHFLAVKNVSYGSRRKPFHIARIPEKGKAKSYALERHLNNDYPEGALRARDLVIFRSGKLRGTGILVDVFRDPRRPLEFSIWLPALRKVRRHSEPDQGDAWGGSLFTYGDVYLRKPEDERHELVGEEIFEECLGTVEEGVKGAPPPFCAAKGRPVWRLRSHTRFADWWYDYRETLVDRETFADYRSIYYKNGKAVKVIDKAWRSMGLEDPRGQYWLYWYGKDLRDGRQGLAWAAREQIRWNRKVDPRLWSLATLRRLSR